MNKLLVGSSSADCYTVYDNTKLADTTPAVYSGTSFYPTQTAAFPLLDSHDSHVSTKTSQSHSPSLNTLYSLNPPALFASSSSSTTMTTDSFSSSSSSSATPSLTDMVDTNETSPFYPELYTTTAETQTPSYQNVSYQTEKQPYQTPLVTSSPMSTSYSGTTSSPRSSIISPTSTITCPTLNMTEPNAAETESAYEGFVPPPPSSSSSLSSFNVTSHGEYEMNSQHSMPSNTNSTSNNTTELRRQIHIQSEQKRRAQIKCGFEELRNELPTCLNKKMSKVALLHRTVQHIQHLKSSQITILTELERLAQENEQMKRFQQTILQNQVMENMYPIP